MNLTRAGAAKVFAGSAHSLDEIDQLARENKPLPRFALPGTLKARAAVTRETFDASNVAGMFEGSDPALKSEYVDHDRASRSRRHRPRRERRRASTTARWTTRRASRR